MPATPSLTFKKRERICSKKLIENLFKGNKSSSLASYPLRSVYIVSERKAGDEAVQILISVPKRNQRHAVDRNRIKRLVREAYRKNKHILMPTLTNHPELSVAIAIIWIGNQTVPAAIVEKRVQNILQRVGEHIAQITHEPADKDHNVDTDTSY